MKEPAAASGALRNVVLPALLALAIMLAVVWYWRVAVVDVGERVDPATPADAGDP